MSRAIAVVRMHFNRKFSTFAMPVILGVGVVILMIVIVVALRGAGVPTASQEFTDGVRTNGGMVWTLAGFLISLGVQAATACFAFATSLGTTRRDYVLGTGVYFLLQTLYVAAILSILLALEKASGHWFMGAYALDVVALGDGNWGAFLLIVLAGTMAMQAMGAMFGASWLRFGSRGPLLIAVAMTALLVVAILILIPRLAAVMAAFNVAWASLILVILGVVAMWAAGMFLRRTSVRGA